jgi:hypothetical protein
MWTNYFNLMMGHGFVGLVNSVHIKEMFVTAGDKISKCSYVLRYSRSVPDVFTVTTFNPITRECNNFRNVGPTLVLPDLLAKMERSGWKLAMFSLDGTIDASSALDCSRIGAPLYVSYY